MRRKKIIIIGAGPSGLSTALNLKKFGINDILVIEKGKFPRYKCCAGYITAKTKRAYKELGLDTDKCHYSLIEDFNIFYRLKNRQTIKNKFLYTNRKIDRVELDNDFYELAKSEQIDILEETYITRDDLSTNIVTLSTGENIAFEYLIFADGTSGYGSRHQTVKHKNIALQATFPTDRKNSIEIHFGITKKGYGWISTYEGTTNVGLTDVYDPKKNYRDIFDAFLKDNDLSCESSAIKGAFTPIETRCPLIGSNIYFVGDAVGACDPFTLSGLRYSLKTGEKCATAIAKNDPSTYKRYIHSLAVKFKLMSLLESIFYLKIVSFLFFNAGCRLFNHLISFAFNHFFVGKK